MQRDQFFSFKPWLKKYTTTREKPVSFAGAAQLVVSCDYKEGYIIKTDYQFSNNGSNTYRCRLQKGRKPYAPKLFDLGAAPLKVKYPTDRLLSGNKVEDLECLISFVYGASQEWLMSLIARQKELQPAAMKKKKGKRGRPRVTAPATPSESEDEDDDSLDLAASDSENELQDYDFYSQ